MHKSYATEDARTKDVFSGVKRRTARENRENAKPRKKELQENSGGSSLPFPVTRGNEIAFLIP